jgi:cell division protein FtsI (penicillin-binding protein 3)
MLIKEELHPIFVKGTQRESGEPSNPVRWAGYSRDFNTIAKSLVISIDKEMHSLDWAKVEIQEGRKAILSGRNIQHGLVPDVKGMGLRDATYLLENNGLSVNHTGVGRVVNQSIPPGTVAKRKSISLTLK